MFIFCGEGEGGLVRALLLARCVVGGDGLLRVDRLALMSVAVCGGLRGADLSLALCAVMGEKESTIDCHGLTVSLTPLL